MIFLSSMRMKLIQFFILSLLLVSCVSLPAINERALSPKSLNMKIETLAGETVFAKGYVVLGTNSRCLYESKDVYMQMLNDYEYDFEAFQNNYGDTRITLLNPNVVMENRNQLEGETLVLKGILITDYDYLNGNPIDLQACSENALVVDEDYLRRLNAGEVL